jgi:hypothetical protein
MDEVQKPSINECYTPSSEPYRVYIYILSGSQAAIKALDKHQITSKLVWDCHQSLMQLAKHNRVQLIWVPGHEVIVGNESEHPIIGPEPACGISFGVAKKAAGTG